MSKHLDNYNKPFHHHTMKTKEILPIWENPEIQEINRLSMQSPLKPFPSQEEAIIDALAGPEFRNLDKNPLYMSLDSPLSKEFEDTDSTNPWKFKIISNPREDLPSQGDNYAVGSKRDNSALLCGWTNQGFDDSSWHPIIVPGTWSRQGGDSKFEGCFDKPHYTNVQMPFQASPPHVPDDNPTGLFRRNFTLPASWKGRRVVLHLGSAESTALIYINGYFAGASKTTRLPSEFNISPFLTEDENLLCIKVIRYSDASYVEDQDQWWLGGIHRTVYLYTSGDSYIKDIKALPGTITGKENKLGKIDLSVTLGGKLPESRSTGNVQAPDMEKESPFIIKYNLYPFSLPSSKEEVQMLAREMIKTSSLISGSIELYADYRLNNNTAEAALVLENPKAWSHEEPNLYILSVELYRDGKQLQCAAFCTGFRNLEIKRRELLINDKMVYIKGANRHEHDEKTGKTLSVEAMVRDIKILKSHNFNAVRTSHYPNDERWYELCDRYGIYLCDEADIECHCFYDQLCNETQWTYAFVSRIQRMVERDKNHTSIIMWSLGNESGYGSNHDIGAAWIRRYDTTRPVHYEGAIHANDNPDTILDIWEQGKAATDFVSPMYPPIDAIIDYVRYRDDYRPLIMCEYSHAMGNSNGSLADYWKAIESHHGLQGGFIWEWRDHGFEAYTQDGIKYWKYGGDFGDEPSDYDFVCDGLLFPDQGLKPVMEECKQVQAPVRLTEIPGQPLNFTLENNYDFSTLEHLSFQYKIYEDAASYSGGKTNIIKQDCIELPFLKPGQKTEISFAGENEFFVPGFGGALNFSGEFILKEDTFWAEKGHVVARTQKLLREEKSEHIIYSSQDLITDHNKDQKAAEEFISLLRPSLYRVATQNDGLKNSIKLREDPVAAFYIKDKAMFPWIDLDLLHLKTAAEKREEIIWEGRSATRFSAVLLAGEKATEQYKHYTAEPGLGTYTLFIAKAEPGQPIILEAVFDLDPTLPELPKIGLAAEIPAAYNEVSWFGLGPEESYPDRLAAALLGRYRHSVEELETPYIVPQENGNRSGVRNFTLLSCDKSKANITVKAQKPINFGISRYSQENMWEALHTYDLIDMSKGQDGKLFLSIDIIQRGVGTATCGPDTREEYRIRPGLYSMRLFVY